MARVRANPPRDLAYAADFSFESNVARMLVVKMAIELQQWRALIVEARIACGRGNDTEPAQPFAMLRAVSAARVTEVSWRSAGQLVERPAVLLDFFGRRLESGIREPMRMSVQLQLKAATEEFLDLRAAQ